MVWVLWLNTLAETLIAVGMFAVPDQFFPGAAGLSSSIARAFAFAILAVAFISYRATWAGTSRETVTAIVLTLLVYHALQLLAQFVWAGLSPPMLIPPVIIHTLACTLLGLYFARLRSAAA